MELLAGRRDAAVAGRGGPADPRRRAHRLLAHPAPDQARALVLRAARRGRRARTGGRAVRDAAGRRRRRADGRQRRRPQALAARRAGGRAHRAHLHPGRAPGGAPARRARPRRRRRRARRGARGRPGALHGLGARRARRRRGLRARAQAQRPGARRQGPDARPAPTRTSARSARGAVWGAFANAGQCGGSDRARLLSCPRSPTASSPPSSAGRRRCASATRAGPTSTSGRC